MRLLLLFVVILKLSLAQAAPTPNEIESKVTSIVSDALEVSSDRAHANSLIEDLGGDVFDVVDISEALEKEYSISISDQEMDKVTKVDDFIQIALKKTR